MDRKEVPPDPSRLIEGLRDTGYVFSTAVADLVDNSVSAGASTIHVNIAMDFGGQISVAVIDDGCGMDAGELENAMKYGSQPRSDPFSLGKFGLGLKTASTAFCRCLSVITRKQQGGPVRKATWDLDHIADADKWELLLPEPTEAEVETLDLVTGGGSGTLVQWDKVDRVLKDYSDPGGKPARNALGREIQAFSRHAAMVYQRFIDPDDQRARTLSLFVNGKVIAPWDPFCVDEPETQVAASEEKTVKFPGGQEASFTMKAYILPRRHTFSSPEAEKMARVGNDTQGLYIYRENRLIHAQDWLRMFNREPHYSLLRVEFSFDHRLDDAFHVDIKKSQVLLSPELYDHIKAEFLGSPRRAAAARYRQGVKEQSSELAKTAHTSSNKSIAEHEDDVKLAATEVTDAASNQIEITNAKGKIQIVVPLVSALHAEECFVKPEPSLNDGLLWEPCLIDGHTAVRINTGHPYYEKVYVPNLASGVIVQGMDSLLWALCEAEWGTISEKTREHSEEIRYAVSRILRRLVDGMPEAPVNGEADE